jgi:hypothetical protein
MLRNEQDNLFLIILRNKVNIYLASLSNTTINKWYNSDLITRINMFIFDVEKALSDAPVFDLQRSCFFANAYRIQHTRNVKPEHNVLNSLDDFPFGINTTVGPTAMMLMWRIAIEINYANKYKLDEYIILLNDMAYVHFDLFLSNNEEAVLTYLELLKNKVNKIVLAWKSDFNLWNLCCIWQGYGIESRIIANEHVADNSYETGYSSYTLEDHRPFYGLTADVIYVTIGGVENKARHFYPYREKADEYNELVHLFTIYLRRTLKIDNQADPNGMPRNELFDLIKDYQREDINQYLGMNKIIGDPAIIRLLFRFIKLNDEICFSYSDFLRFLFTRNQSGLINSAYLASKSPDAKLMAKWREKSNYHLQVTSSGQCISTDIWTYIVTYLTCYDLIRLKSTCYYFNKIFSNQSILSKQSIFFEKSKKPILNYSATPKKISITIGKKPEPLTIKKLKDGTMVTVTIYSKDEGLMPGFFPIPRKEIYDIETGKFLQKINSSDEDKYFLPWRETFNDSLPSGHTLKVYRNKLQIVDSASNTVINEIEEGHSIESVESIGVLWNGDIIYSGYGRVTILKFPLLEAANKRNPLDCSVLDNSAEFFSASLAVKAAASSPTYSPF